MEAVDFIKRNRNAPSFSTSRTMLAHSPSGKPDVLRKYERKPGAGKEQNNPVHVC